MIEYRPASLADAPAISGVQEALYRTGKNTWFSTVEEVHENYFDPIHGIACTVAVMDSEVVGFQSVKRAWEGNHYEVEPGWGVIGTHIHPEYARMGIGRALFTLSLAAAQAAGIPTLDATIGSRNEAGLAYYRAMGFTPYEELEHAIRYRFDLDHSGIAA